MNIKGLLPLILLGGVAYALANRQGTSPITNTPPSTPSKWDGTYTVNTVISGNPVQGTVAPIAQAAITQTSKTIDIMNLSEWMYESGATSNFSSGYRSYLSNVLPFPLPRTVQTYGITNRLPDINTVAFNANSMTNLQTLGRQYGYNIV